MPPRETSKRRPTGPAQDQTFLSPFRQTATAINPGGAATLGPRRGGRLCSKSFATAASAGKPSSAFRTVATARRPNGSTASGMTSDVSKAGATRLEPATQPRSPVTQWIGQRLPKPSALVSVWRSCDRRVRINQLRSVSREELTYLIGGHGPGEQVPLTEITAEILQRAQLPFGFNPFGDGN